MKKNDDEIQFICPKCKFKKSIPTDIVQMLDATDGVLVDTSVPPRFECEKCNVKMVSIHYISIYGIEHTYLEN